MNFTPDQINTGVEFLKKHDFYDVFQNFAIPTEWHDGQSVPCLDEFEMSRRSYIVIKGGVFDAGYEWTDIKYDLGELLKIQSCNDLAIFIYDLMKHVQELD